MTNKKFIITDLILFFLAICLFIVSAFVQQTNQNALLIISIIVTLCSVFVIVTVMLFNYRTNKRVSLINVIVPFGLMIFLYGLFYLPAFGFISNLGLHNGVCGLFVFTLFSRSVFNVEFIIRNKTVTRTKTIMGNKVTSAGILCRILRIYSIGILFGGMVLAILNAFYPVIDMSIPYQLWILHKPFQEIVSRKAII